MTDLSNARLYLVTGASIAAGAVVDFVPSLVEAGVDVLQLREKEMEAGDLVKVSRPIAAACRAAGIPFIVNDRPDVAVALGADGVHLGQNDLPVDVARRIVGRSIIGRSTHSAAQVDASDTEDVDYVAVGPVHETPTKPGRPAAGIELVRYAAGRIQVPWFAIGGIDERTLGPVLEAGAARIVVVRAITESADPAAAATRLRRMLDAASR